MKIVHIEDDKNTRKAVKDLLESKGYTVISIDDPKKTITKIKKEKPGLVLLDVMMPEMCGWKLYTKIRRADKKVKVAFLSLLDVSKERKNRLAKEGIFAYIQKPFTARDLITTVKECERC